MTYYMYRKDPHLDFEILLSRGKGAFCSCILCTDKTLYKQFPVLSMDKDSQDNKTLFREK